MLVMSNSLVRKDTMPDRWLEPQAYKKQHRLLYIIRLQSHTPRTCPECGAELVYEEDCEVYCPKCGLVVMDSIPYVGGEKITYPYGLRLG